MPIAEDEIPAPRYREIHYCPRCGVAYRPQDFYPVEHLFLCTGCGFDFYQNPLPSAVVVLKHPDRADDVLLLKRSTAPGIGHWCLPGGFIRYGEAPAAAAAREAREEAGVEVQIGPVLSVGLLDYIYRGRQLCILEVAYLAHLSGPLPAAGLVTQEASEVVFRPVAEVLGTPETLAFPEQMTVLRDYQTLLALQPGAKNGQSPPPCAPESWGAQLVTGRPKVE
ncbi:MAG: NUDIX hydrolase [Propionivibrio sp.]|nr:NUDIX hydrolase [Propionivibrio sp.]